MSTGALFEAKTDRGSISPLPYEVQLHCANEHLAAVQA
jgi:hypothetical protein